MSAAQQSKASGEGNSGSCTVKDPVSPRRSDSARTVVSGDGAQFTAVHAATAPDRVGRFLVVRELGAGAMGRVFLAYDPELDRKLAIKLVGSGMSARSLREAHALARLSHPNVVQIYETGEHRGLAFIAMEYVPGQTLERWISAPHDWREVFEMYIQAARGLAAAHEAGIVHRDFKPPNVLVGLDGRARVADFGLARAAEEPGSSSGGAPSRSGRFSTTITRGAGLLGTPAYMAPEQFSLKVSSPLSDQYNFCVALFEGLYDARPFAGKTIDELAHAVRTQPPRPRPHWTRVPRRVHEVILRGLHVDPSQRWPNMEALVAALTRAAARRRADLLLTIGASAVASTLVLTQALGFGAAPPDQAGAAQIHAVWNDARRASLRAAFAATDLDYASNAADGVVAALDRYASTWLIAHRSAMETSWARRDRKQGATAVDVTVHCLGGRLRELEAAVTSLTDFTDPRTVERAGQAAWRLSPIDACVRGDGESAPRPMQIELAVRVEGVRAALVQAEAALHAGQVERARVLCEAMRSQVVAAGYDPLRAEFTLLVGRIALERGDHDAAEAAQRSAHQTAFTSGHDRVALRAATEMLLVAGVHRGDAVEGGRWSDTARAWVDRIGGASDRAGFFNHLGAFYRRHDRYAESLASFERAIELREGLAESDPLDLAIVRNNLAGTLTSLGRHAEAVEQHTRILELRRARLGERHPLVASTYNNLGSALHDLGRFDEAAEALGRALELRSQLLGGAHVLVARTSSNLGIVEGDRGRYEVALRHQHRAHAIARSVLGDEHRDTLTTRLNLALAQARLRHHDEAIATVEAVIQAQTRLGLAGTYEAAFAQTTLGKLLVDARRVDAAAVALERALAVSQKLFGSEHPALAGVHEGLGRLALLRGEWSVAVERLERAIGLSERASGGSHVSLAWPLVHLVAAHLGGGDVERARAAAARAAALVERVTAEPLLRGLVQLARGRALIAADRRVEAEAAAQAALREFDALGARFAPERAEAEALLASMRATSGA